MKKLLKLGTFLAVLTLTLAPTLAPAFNPATHIYIAGQVFENCSPKIDLNYGSIAPDLAMYVADPASWLDTFTDTHEQFINLSNYAFGPTQKAFAKGWLTHNELWGADYYAHISYPLNENDWSQDGYVIEKAESLSNMVLPLVLPLEFAHYAIEVAIDLLIKKNDDPFIGSKLLFANLLRSWQDRNLMVRVLVWKYNRTDWLTLAATELAFRNLVGRYASALALPSPEDEAAIVELAVQLAEEMFDMQGITSGQVADILEAAIGLCVDDYKGVIDSAIHGIKAGPQ
jgi:hypothetical protein